MDEPPLALKPAKVPWFSSIFSLHSAAYRRPSFLVRIISRVTLTLRGQVQVLPSLSAFLYPPPVPEAHITHINDLPNELLLEVFVNLPLKSLVAAQGVSRRWRQLVPCSKIRPARLALFQFYLKVVHSPHFELTRPWVLANLRSFDRQAFVDTLLEQYHYLPETFCLWILEWPARAVVGCVWPGLPDVDCGLKAAVGVERVSGYNWLGQMPATVSTMGLKQKVGVDLVPGICIWSWADGYVWLMLDERESLRDKVFSIEERARLASEEGGEFDSIYSGWLEWLEERWNEVEEVCRGLTDENHDYYYLDADRAVEYLRPRPGPPQPEERPGEPWSRRLESL